MISHSLVMALILHLTLFIKREMLFEQLFVETTCWTTKIYKKI